MMNMELQHKHDFRAKLHIFATIGITLSLLLFAGIASLFLIEIEDVIYADGKITSELPVEVVGIVDGRILKLNVDEGDDVRKGEVLAQIDATKYEEEYASIQSAIHELEAELEVKRAGLEALKANPLPKELWYAETNLSESRDRLKRTATRLERLESLRDKHAISQHEYENAEIEFIQTKRKSPAQRKICAWSAADSARKPSKRRAATSRLFRRKSKANAPRSNSSAAISTTAN